MGSALDHTEEATTPSTSVLRRPSRAPNGVELELLALIEKGKRCEAVDSALIMGLYRQLEPVSIKFMIGTWHGSLFNGQSGDGWWGKNMISQELVQPLLFLREDGQVFSNEAWGLAHLELGSFDTLSPTAMLKYNDKPLHDFFRRVTDETVIGLTPAALVGGEADFFFQLTRDHNTQVVR